MHEVTAILCFPLAFLHGLRVVLFSVRQQVFSQSIHHCCPLALLQFGNRSFLLHRCMCWRKLFSILSLASQWVLAPCPHGIRNYEYMHTHNTFIPVCAMQIFQLDRKLVTVWRNECNSRRVPFDNQFHKTAPHQWSAQPNGLHEIFTHHKIDKSISIWYVTPFVNLHGKCNKTLEALFTNHMHTSTYATRPVLPNAVQGYYPS